MELLSGNESREKFYGQRVELPIQRVLQNIALAHARE